MVLDNRLTIIIIIVIICICFITIFCHKKSFEHWTVLEKLKCQKENRSIPFCDALGLCYYL